MRYSEISSVEEIVDAAVKLSFFASVPRERLKKAIMKCESVTADASEALFKKGESYHKGLYILLQGRVRMTDGGNREVIIDDGGVIGISTFIGKSTYRVTAYAERACSMLFMPEILVYKLMEDVPEFRSAFHILVAERNAELEGRSSWSVASTTYKPLGSYMSSPIISVNISDSVLEASKLMAECNVGAIVVCDDGGELRGLLTSKHVVQRFIPDMQNNPADISSGKYMERNPVALPAEFPLVEALAQMQHTRADYVVVVRGNFPVGILSNNDISRMLFHNINVFVTYVEKLDTLEELKKAYEDMYSVASSLMENSRVSYDILPVLSSVHLNIQRKIYRMCGEEFHRETGFDLTMVRHTLMIMGSGGRREMALDPDQDNGFIFDDNVTDEQIAMFIRFGAKYSDALAYVGYEKCKGNVMVTNPEMSLRISDWKHKISKWVSNPGSLGIMWSSIIFDFDGFAGDEKLVWELRNHICSTISQSPVFLIQMLERDSGLRIPISMFGKFIGEKDGKHKGEINLKSSASAFIVDVIRAFTLKHGLNDLNTVERMKTLRRMNVISEELYLHTLEAYETIVDITLKSQVEKAATGVPVNKYINPDELSLYNRERLKKALGHTQKLLNIGLRYFKGHP
ncbi:putative nucleotidyltransferase substrate binding domain-containing protein [Seleniivibrio woodruffii]|uniref:putative nucleotidyltransferase substrate binding domain-containing protein n=1 Tax=Seleniivibrio woodruffii TaxID=1078050 RepID=UPI0039E3A914